MIMKEANHTTMQLPRSFSTSMLSSDNSRQQSVGLVRASSAGATQINIADLERLMVQKQNHELQSSVSTKGVPRSCSLGMGRIDEDRASSFRDDNFLFAKRSVVKDNGSRLSRNLSHTRES